MRKLLIASIFVFFLVFFVETIGFDYSIGDHHYYTTTGGLWQGHDLTLIVARPLSRFGDAILPIFFNFIFVLGVYFLIKPFCKYPEWAFLLAPITPLATVYAQIFALGLFFLMLGFWFRDKKKTALLFLFLTFFAHYWTGIFVTGIFGLYILIGERKSLKYLIPIAIITGFFFFCLPQSLGFLTEHSTITTTSVGLTTAGFFYLYSRGLSFFVLSLFGLYLLYSRHRNFFKINLMLFFIPLIIVFCLPLSNYWDWRLFYFMPFLVLVSILLSHLFERTPTNSSVLYNSLK